jgi:hypothetical protein
MRAVWRIRFTWVFAIVFGALSAMGEGLHLLPGQGHDACCHEHGDDCPDDDHCRAADNSSPTPVRWLSGSSGRTITDNSTLRLCDDESCAICKFFGQAIWFTQTAPVLDWQFLLRFQRPAKKVVVVCRWEHLPFLARAPPVVEAC